MQRKEVIDIVISMLTKAYVKGAEPKFLNTTTGESISIQGIKDVLESEPEELVTLKSKLVEYFKLKDLDCLFEDEGCDSFINAMENAETEVEAESAMSMLEESFESIIDAEEKIEQELREMCGKTNNETV